MNDQNFTYELNGFVFRDKKSANGYQADLSLDNFINQNFNDLGDEPKIRKTIFWQLCLLIKLHKTELIEILSQLDTEKFLEQDRKFLSQK